MGCSSSSMSRGKSTAVFSRTGKRWSGPATGFARRLGNWEIIPRSLRSASSTSFRLTLSVSKADVESRSLSKSCCSIAKEEAPDCLVTFVNFPTTEFLEVGGCDFTCFNVYLHDEKKFGGYLDRLQHIAGNKPLVLGEYGIDSHREGDVEQAAMLTRHLRQVFRHGLAGSVIFAYTDDWFTGGHQIDDWFFGITRVDRSDKVAAAALRRVWKELPDGMDDEIELPKVSVVVCSYNGGKTLRECLDSLMRLDYPDYEVILVDDGSTDETAEIAAEFPQVIYQHQENQGLSVARNVGAELGQRRDRGLHR